MKRLMTCPTRPFRPYFDCTRPQYSDMSIASKCPGTRSPFDERLRSAQGCRPHTTSGTRCFGEKREGVVGIPPRSTARATAPSLGRPTPEVVTRDTPSGGSVDTTNTRSGPQRVRMSGGERPIGAAKGKQSDPEALCHPHPSLRPIRCREAGLTCRPSQDVKFGPSESKREKTGGGGFNEFKRRTGWRALGQAGDQTFHDDFTRLHTTWWMAHIARLISTGALLTPAEEAGIRSATPVSSSGFTTGTGEGDCGPLLGACSPRLSNPKLCISFTSSNPHPKASCVKGPLRAHCVLERCSFSGLVIRLLIRCVVA